jgi:hypothetical protein
LMASLCSSCLCSIWQQSSSNGQPWEHAESDLSGTGSGRLPHSPLLPSTALKEMDEVLKPHLSSVFVQRAERLAHDQNALIRGRYLTQPLNLHRAAPGPAPFSPAPTPETRYPHEPHMGKTPIARDHQTLKPGLHSVAHRSCRSLDRACCPDAAAGPQGLKQMARWSATCQPPGPRRSWPTAGVARSI